MSRAWLLVCLGPALLISATCAEGFAGVKPGMTESEVETAVGKPTFVQMDQREAQAVFPPGSECRKAVVRALVYERRLREDVVIGIDVRGRVACQNNIEFARDF